MLYFRFKIFTQLLFLRTPIDCGLGLGREVRRAGNLVVTGTEYQDSKTIYEKFWMKTVATKIGRFLVAERSCK